MPNWCQNELKVYGKPKEIERFQKKAINPGDEEKLGSAFSMDKFIPTPKKLLNGSGWYDWRGENWGTKWDVDACLEWGCPEDEYLEYTFDSAWAPPTTAIETIAKKFKKLKFILKYEEPGMCYMGVFKCEKGEVTQDEQLEY